MTDAALDEILSAGGLAAGAPGEAEIAGADPVFPTRFRIGAAGAAAIAASAIAAAELWRLRSGHAQRQKIAVDLEKQTVTAGNHSFAFEVDPFRKHCLLNGLDDIGLTMQKLDAIGNFEKKQQGSLPWLYEGSAA